MIKQLIKSIKPLSLAILLGLGASVALKAQDAAEGPSTADLKIAADTLWVLIAGFLVFWMNAGFGCVESGLCRAKNAVNILAKNFVVFAISSLAFWAVGFAIMFGDGNSFMGLQGWFLAGADNSPAMGDAYQGIFGSLNWTGVPLLAKFFFQLVFAGTAATIVSGCVAERIHYRAFMFFTVVLVGIAYPITGHWIWGGGWLGSMGMRDFAGSTVVHSVGGWAGLMGPKNLPKPIVAKLRNALIKAVSDPATNEGLKKVGAEPVTSTPEEFARLIASDWKSFGEAIRVANLKTD